MISHLDRLVLTCKVRLAAAALRSASGLRLVAVAAAGTDNIDKAAAAQLGIEVANLPDYGPDSVAEHVIATLFALRRHVLTCAAAAIGGRWTASGHFCWTGSRISDLGGTVFGVAGRGRIGEAAARWSMPSAGVRPARGQHRRRRHRRAGRRAAAGELTAARKRAWVNPWNSSGRIRSTGRAIRTQASMQAFSNSSTRIARCGTASTAGRWTCWRPAATRCSPSGKRRMARWWRLRST